MLVDDPSTEGSMVCEKSAKNGYFLSKIRRTDTIMLVLKGAVWDPLNFDLYRSFALVAMLYTSGFIKIWRMLQ